MAGLQWTRHGSFFKRINTYPESPQSMKILVVHPVFSYQGGGENLCCQSIRTLVSHGHEITLLTENFDFKRIERFFGCDGLFENVNLLLYPTTRGTEMLGSSSHIIRHLRGQKRGLRPVKRPREAFDIIFSTQDAAYIPDLTLPVVQWGYFPAIFPDYFPRWPLRALRTLALRLHYQQKISRIGLLLAISEYSKFHFDKEWKRPSLRIYPPCNMVTPKTKRSLVVTAGRAAPEKRLELFWQVARTRPEYQFLMLAIRDTHHEEYAASLSRDCPRNGKIVFNAPRETYYGLLGEASVYVHLMKHEYFGITIVEAMSAACVPVVHDFGAPREIVDLDVGYRWQTMEGLPALIDEAMRRSPSKSARSRAEEFNAENFEKRLASVFSGLRVGNQKRVQLISPQSKAHT